MDYLTLAVVISLIVGLIFVVVWMLLALFVYEESKRRGSRHPILWALLVFLTGLLGLLVWLILRPKEKDVA